MAIKLDNRKTLFISVEKDTNKQYTIRVTDAVWNDIQILLLEGSNNKDITLELHYDGPKVSEKYK